MDVTEADQKESLINSIVGLLTKHPLVREDAALIERFVQGLYGDVPAELLAKRGPADLSREALQLFDLAEQAIKSEKGLSLNLAARDAELIERVMHGVDIASAFPKK